MDFGMYRMRYLERVLAGDRGGCREILSESLQTGTPACTIYTELFWPIMEEIDRLYRGDKIDRITEHMATRINRTLVDQLQSKLPHAYGNGRKIIIVCADDEPEELGAQMCSDLFESEGWEVRFLGGGVPNDETISMTTAFQPHILFIYGTKPSGAPDVRRLIDSMRAMDSCPGMRIMLSGGVFNRAEGLWEEVGADLFAPTAREALQIALTDRKAKPSSKRRSRRSRLREENIEEVNI